MKTDRTWCGPTWDGECSGVTSHIYDEEEDCWKCLNCGNKREAKTIVLPTGFQDPSKRPDDFDKSEYEVRLLGEEDEE